MPKSELENLKATLRESKLEGKKVVFTNGVFDILHVGHVTYLEAAKQLGDLLVVGLNNDDSVRRLNKGPERPINGEQARARVLSALRAVDGVVIFGEDTPLDLINELQPDILVKGGDYNPEELDTEHPKYMIGSTEVRAWGGLVKTIPTVEGFSTTGIVKKLKS